MAASGTTPHASAWTHWARPISDPSAQTIELLDMFCALKGATDTPRRASHRHSPAVTRLLPASDVVPATSSPLATASPTVDTPIDRPTGVHHLDELAHTCADLDERRLDDGGEDVAATYVDDHLVALLGARSEQRQSDSLLQSRRERPGGDFTQQRAVCALDLAVRTRNPTARGQQTPGDALGTRGLLCDERVLAPECVLLPANGPAGPSLHRSDVQAQLVTVQRVAHLGTQGIARTQATGQPVIRCRGLDQRVPESQRVVPARDQLVATLAGVAGAADDDRLAVPVGLDERHVLVAGRQTKSLEDLVALVALNRDNAVSVVEVLDLQARGRCRLQPAYNLSSVGGVGNQEDVVLGAQVDDEVIDHPAGLVAAQGVLRLALVDATQVVGQAGVDERRGAGAPDAGLAQVADIEDADAFTDGRVLAHHASSGVLDRHLPAAEVSHLGSKGNVTVVEGGGLERGFSHGAHGIRTPVRYPHHLSLDLEGQEPSDHLDRVRSRRSRPQGRCTRARLGPHR